MYSQDLFVESRPAALFALMRRYPLGTLVLQGLNGLQADLMPMELVVDAAGAAWLRGHASRRHDLALTLADAAAGGGRHADGVAAGQGVPALVVFQGPNHFIRPRWYVNGQASRRNAPSWNHVAVQARGRLHLVDDTGWMVRHLSSLTELQEAGRPDRWCPDTDMAPAVLADAAARLIGWEMTLDDLFGRRFLSQQRTPADRAALVRHLRAEPSGMAHDLADLIADIDRAAPGLAG